MDFIEYVVSELKSKRLSKDNALSLVRQFSIRSNAKGVTGALHPLVQINTSDLNSQRYSSRFNGQESFLADHQVDISGHGAQKILPGAAYLEMARAAIVDAVAEVATGDLQLTLNNIVWAIPLIVEQETQVHIDLYANEQNQIAFEIYTFDNDEQIIHCHGYADFSAPLKPGSLAISDIHGKTIDANVIYEDFRKMGLLYGPAHQAIQKLYLDNSSVLAQLYCADAKSAAYALHPSIIDGAFQASVGLSWEVEQNGSPYLPFAIEQLRLCAPCSENSYVRISLNETAKKISDILKLDIEIFDQQGKLCVQIIGFSSRKIAAAKKQDRATVKQATNTSILEQVIAVPEWVESPLPVSSSSGEYAQHHIILAGFDQIASSQIVTTNNPGLQFSLLSTAAADIDTTYKDLAVKCFAVVQDILQLKPSGKVAIQLLIAGKPDANYLLGLTGLLKTASLENPAVHTQCILVDAASDMDKLTRIAQQNLSNNIGDTIKYNDHCRQVLSWREITSGFDFSKPANSAFKDNGVYVITGGLGGLGQIFIKEILVNTRYAQVIATGRKAITPEMQQLLTDLSSGENRLHYRQLDVVNYEEVNEFFREIKSIHTEVNGILHCAGMAADNFIIKKTSAEFLQVMEPKVDGTVNLDRASSGFELDFFVAFSSIASTFGNPGQADYATANGFMDNFAHTRNLLVRQGSRHGLTLSINWPLWRDGGFKAGDEHVSSLKESLGMHPLQTTTGLRAFNQCLLHSYEQVLVIEGNTETLREVIFQQAEPAPSLPLLISDKPALAKTTLPANALLEKTISYLKGQLAGLLKIAEHKLDAKAPFEVYGIDSILAVNLTNHLENFFGKLPKTLFFEYQTLAALASYFVDNQRVLLQQLFGDETGSAANNEAQEKAHEPIRSNKPTVRKNRFMATELLANRNAERAGSVYEPIAIVGLSGRYPGATDINDYWNNLRDGKDCITEVPSSRWDWKKYFNSASATDGEHTSKWGGFINGVEEFDPKFFNISPREAEHIDPQERLFLQHAWLAVEDAGYTRASLQIGSEQYLAGQVGVYVGVMYGEYNISGSLASIANRVSYFLNIHGPSMTLDTMCSSSLTAIHLACQDLILKRTDLGIAGGVNVSVHPNKYSMLSAGQFISSDGHCQSFGEGGDGYIPGEGVGAVVLKRLVEAKRDGNVIYGIIRGSALNHGGKTNGYTVPNPQAQADVIERALRDSGVNPRQVSYLEAHGTGTKLGDPIEIAALGKAFGKYTTDKQFCLLGSAKSNIGHCESAAGIAGLTKILLQMKHRKVVPSLHSARLNPHIDFDNSPFVVNQSLTEWNGAVIDGATSPLVAGLSSFGAGGANAHILLEEYLDDVGAAAPLTPVARIIIPLSAKAPEQLRQKVIDLLAFVRSNAHKSNEPSFLMSLAFTLQVGREAMDERLGFIVGTQAQLDDKLQAFADGVVDAPDIYSGQVKNNKETLSILMGDDDFAETVDKWIINGKMPKLVDLWVKGFDLDWRKLYGDSTPRFISLPGYPFAKEKYWIDPVTQVKAVIAASSHSHPFLHTNTSNFHQQSYISSFSGDEHFIRDYRVDGRAILAADIYLEMSRVAIAQAWPEVQSKVLELREVCWGLPYECRADKKLSLELFAQDSDAAEETIGFEIYSEEKNEEIVHCQGSAIYLEMATPSRLHVDELRSVLQQGNSTGKEWLYQQLLQKGCVYGAGLQVINALALSAQQVVASIRGEQLTLASGIMAAVVQLSSALCGFQTVYLQQIDSVRIFSDVASAAYIRVCRSEHGNSLEVDVCDGQGKILLQLRGLSLLQVTLPGVIHEPEQIVERVSYAVNSSVVNNSIANSNVAALADLDLSAIPLQTVPSEKPTGVLLTPLAELPVLQEGSTREKVPPLQLATFAELENAQLTPAVTIAQPQPALQFNSVVSPVSQVPVKSSVTPGELQAMLRKSLADALFLQEADIDSDRSFVDLGLDSIVGVEWIKVINKHYGINISATRVYDYSTIAALASFIREEIEKTIDTSSLTASLTTVINPPQVEKKDIVFVSAPVIKKSFSREMLQQQLQESLAAALYLSSADIELDRSFVDLGLDSIVGVEWVKAINKQYNLQMSATRVYDYSSIQELANYLLGEIALHPAESETATVDVNMVAAPAMVAAVSGSLENFFPLVTSFPTIVRRIKENKGRKNLASASGVVADKVAIVGMSGRYPKSSNLQEYWDNLVAGTNAVTEVPANRWNVNDYYDPDPTKPGKIYCKWLGALDDVDMFDPLFFQISPSEAELMDPQHRLFMQESYRAFENAGYCAASLSNKKCGVYMGIMSSEYAQLLAQHDGQEISTTGNSFAIGAARIAYYLNLKGPAIPIDTACSSSLVAIHLGVQALLNREIDMALAGGVSLYLIPESYLGMCQAGMLSPDGQCKTFDNSANGFVPGEGVGAVILKRLSDAERDGDPIHGVILGSAINQDGKTNGITAPSVNSQIELERDFYARYNIDPESISYVETHGTGTKLGDPIELEALATVYSEKTSSKNFCALGSVKTNLGHTSGAAGVASVQKVLLCMKHKTLVPSLNITTENVHFDFKRSPFYISTETKVWHSTTPRRAAVSSFGFSGTNAHLVIEEYAQRSAISSNKPAIIPLSARTQNQLVQRAEDLAGYLVLAREAGELLSLDAIAYTLQSGRDTMRERMVLIASSIEQLQTMLAAYLAGNFSGSGLYLSAPKSISAYPSVSADEAIANWLAYGDHEIARLWVEGNSINWNSLYQTGQPTRVSLPGYPFAKERYWVAQADVARSDSKTVAEENQDIFYTPCWLTAPLSQPDQQWSGKVWMLDKNSQLSDAFSALNSEAEVTWINTGSSSDDGAIDSTSTVSNKLSNAAQIPDAILINLPVMQDQSSGKNIDQALAAGFYQLFEICRSLMQLKHPREIKVIALVAQGAADVPAEYAALGGFFRSLHMENPVYSGALLHCEFPVVAEAVAKCVTSELLAENSATEIHYYQDAKSPMLCRQVRQFVPTEITENLLPELPLKHRGVYVVTGGLGGLGFILSDYLARNYQAKLALIGRSELLTQDKKLEQLRALGAEVLYCCADVADDKQIAAAFDNARATFGAIQGIIHCAGIQKDAFIINKNREDIESTLVAKVYGTRNLDTASACDQLDLFVMFSSIAGALGNPGQADYAFANHFMDAYATSREKLVASQERSGKTLSINWPYWLEGGMTLSPDTMQEIYRHTGIDAVSTSRGLGYFELSLRTPLLQVLPLYGLSAKIQTYINSSQLGARNPEKIINRETADYSFDLDTLFTKTRDYLRLLVSKETKLSLERIDDHERFEAYGFDSIMIGRFNTALSGDLGELPKTLLYQHETIHDVATYLVTEHAKTLNAFFGLDALLITPSATDANLSLPMPAAEQTEDVDDAIAIIGIHGYYPESDTLDELWNNLMQARDLIEEVPQNRWSHQEFFDADPNAAVDGKIYCKWGGFLNRFDKFDAEFFNIQAEEARAIDPQERLFLQSVWSVIEDAGYTREQLKLEYPKAKSANVGVFVGVTTNTYHLLATEERIKGNVVNPAALPWSIANRVSYYFDFQGPSMPIDTACSSSLVALHLACESLKNNECQVAIAGGVNLYLHPAKYQAFCSKNMLAANGKCRSFGAGDDGFIPGEGVGTVMLKPLSRALKDKDNVYAVIRASAYDHCGRSNGYSAPNPNSQAQVVSKALAKAGISAASIGYVEAHATGTQLGDSLEIGALTQVFNTHTDNKQYCAIGSLKTNIGHSESASSIAGLTKIILQLKYKYLAPSLHSEPANPNIDFASSPFYVPHKPQPWHKPVDAPRRAMLNAFGAGGVNACMIIEEHEPVHAVESDLKNNIFILSAKSSGQLRPAVEQLAKLLKHNSSINLASLCYTLQIGREAMEQRVAVIAKDVTELINGLDCWLSNRNISNVIHGTANPGAARAIKNLDELLVAGDWLAIASAWVNGARIDWAALYRDTNPGRISLPSYSFQEKRFWISDSNSSISAASGAQEFLHPLLSQNVSTLKQISFCSYLGADEYYAAEHVISGRRIFPGAGYLEIACVAGAIAGELPVHKIKDLVWVQPLDLSKGNRVARTFLRTIGNSTEFEITSVDDNNEVVVHSEGRLEFADSLLGVPSRESIVLRDIYERCDRIEEGDQCYENFKKYGFDYGPGFKPIKTFYTDGSSVALAHLELAAGLIQDFDRYILHPSIIDGALQTVIGLVGIGQSEIAYLPFALDEVEIYGQLPTRCLVLAEIDSSEEVSASSIKKYNIQIMNLNGDVVIKINNFYIRALAEEVVKDVRMQKADK